MGTDEDVTARDSTFHDMVLWIIFQAGIHIGQTKLLHIRVIVKDRLQG